MTRKLTERQYALARGVLVASHAITFFLALGMLIVPLVERHLFMAYFVVIPEPRKGVRFASAYMIASAAFGAVQPLYFFYCMVAYPLVRQRYWMQREHERCLAAAAANAQATVSHRLSNGASSQRGPPSVDMSSAVHNPITVMNTSTLSVDSHADSPPHHVLIDVDRLPPMVPLSSRTGPTGSVVAAASEDKLQTSSVSKARVKGTPAVTQRRRRASQRGDSVLSLTDPSQLSFSSPSSLSSRSAPRPPPAHVPPPLRMIALPPSPRPLPTRFEPPLEERDAVGDTTAAAGADHSTGSHPSSVQSTRDAYGMSLSHTAPSTAVRSGGPSVALVRSFRRQHQPVAHPSFYVSTVPPTSDAGAATTAMAAGYDDGGARDGSDGSGPCSPLAPEMGPMASEHTFGAATAVESSGAARRRRPLPRRHHGTHTLAALVNSEGALSRTVSTTTTSTKSTGTERHINGSATSSVKQAKRSSPKKRSGADDRMRTPLTAEMASPSMSSRTHQRGSHFASEGGASISVRNVYTDGSSMAVSKRSMVEGDPTMAPTTVGLPAASVQEREGRGVMSMSGQEVQVPTVPRRAPPPPRLMAVSAGNIPDRCTTSRLLRFLPWHAYAPSMAMTTATTEAAEAPEGSLPPDGQAQFQWRRTSRQPSPSRASQSLRTEMLHRHLKADGFFRVTQSAYFWLTAPCILLTYYFGISWIMKDQLASLRNRLTMADGWNMVFIYRTVPTAVDEALCMVQRARQCSGGSALCNATSYANATAAHAVYCPYCTASQQLIIATFTHLCSDAYDPGSTFSTAFLVLLALCVTTSLVAFGVSVLSCGVDVLPTLPYATVPPREKEEPGAEMLLLRDGLFAVPAAATDTAPTLALPTPPQEEINISSEMPCTTATSADIASTLEAPAPVAPSRERRVHAFKGLHAPVAALLPRLSAVMAEIPTSVRDSATAAAAAGSPSSRLAGDCSYGRSSEGHGAVSLSLVDGVDDPLDPLHTVGDNVAASTRR